MRGHDKVNESKGPFPYSHDDLTQWKEMPFHLPVYTSSCFHIVSVDGNCTAWKEILEYLQCEKEGPHFQNADLQIGLVGQPCALYKTLSSANLQHRCPWLQVAGERGLGRFCPQKHWILESTMQDDICTSLDILI